jgi:hypothetical protein
MTTKEIFGNEMCISLVKTNYQKNLEMVPKFLMEYLFHGLNFQ